MKHSIGDKVFVKTQIGLIVGTVISYQETTDAAGSRATYRCASYDHEAGRWEGYYTESEILPRWDSMTALNWLMDDKTTPFFAFAEQEAAKIKAAQEAADAAERAHFERLNEEAKAAAEVAA